MMNGGQLLTGTPSSWLTTTAYTVGDLVLQGGTNYYCKVAHTSGTFATDLAAGKWYAMPAGNILEVPLPYTEDDLDDLKFEQSADTLVITIPRYAPATLTRTSNTKWIYTAISFGAAQKPPTSVATGAAGTKVYALTAVSETGEESVISNTVSSTDTATLTWTKATGAVYYNIYEQVFGSWGWKGQVGDVNTCTLSSMTPAFASSTPDWTKGPPTAINYFSGANNYPGCACFNQQRLLFARTNNYPQNVFGSVVGNPYSFNKSSPVQADDSFNFSVAVSAITGVPEIKHLLSFTKGVFVFSEAGESLMTGGSGQGTAITPSSVNITPQSNWGCSDVKPIIAGKSVLFVDRTGKRVRDLLYQITFDSYDTNDVTVMANHLFASGQVKSWCFVQYPQPILWLVTTDGQLLSLAYAIDRKQNITAWHRHDTDGLFEDIMAVPNASKSMDVYVVVKRTVNGSDVRYIELMDDRVFTDHTDGFFVDSGLVYDDPKAISAISQANPCQITCAGHGLSNGDIVTLKGIKGMTTLNHSRFLVANATTNTFTIKGIVNGDNVNSTSYPAYISGGYARKAVEVIGNLAHLEGKTVIALCDGRVERNHVVSGGQITLDKPAGYVVVGLPITWQLKPMKFVMQLRDGSSIDRTKQISEIYLRLYRTRSVYASPDENTDPDEVPLYGTIDNNGAMGLVTAERKVFIKKSEELRQGTICFSSDDPCPCTILDATARVSYGQR